MAEYSTYDSHPYIFLWSAEDKTTDIQRSYALKKGSEWPGIPSNIMEPNHISVDVSQYIDPAIPTKPLGGRKMGRRGKGGYAGLSNYNTIP